MPDELSQVYWDASCFSSYINGHAGRVDTLDSVLEEARTSKGGLEVVTSVVSRVEVAYSLQEDQQRQLSDDEEARIAKFWADNSVVKTVELYDLIVDEARGLIRQVMPSRLRLKPMDAIHLATAKRLGVREIHTYDKKWLNQNYVDLIGITINEPNSIQPMLPNFGPTD
ncbi:MAG: PIN domain-containing protein [Chloroflexi bacterium]|nr:PIN domain-containing protein [Chloroflexota bacterium]